MSEYIYRGGVVEFLTNIALKTGMILLINWIGWITLMSDGRPTQRPGELVGIAIICAIIFMVITVVSLLLSFGIALVLWIFLGGFILWMMARILPQFIELNGGFWLTVLSGFFILAIRLPVRKRKVEAL